MKSAFLKVRDNRFTSINHEVQRENIVSGKHNPKLSNQRTGPFLIKRRIGRLAYELELPPRWGIHSVVSVTQLESASAEEDPYQRPRPDHSGEVEVEEMPNTEWKENYEVERILDKRVRRFGRIDVIQYLVKWLGYGPEYNE